MMFGQPPITSSLQYIDIDPESIADVQWKAIFQLPTHVRVVNLAG